MFALVLVCQFGYGQKNVNKLFDEFSKYDNTTRIKIGKTAMIIAGLFQNTMGVDGIEVIHIENCTVDVKEQFREAVRGLKDSAFDTLVNANEDGRRTKIMVRIKNDVIHELVVLTSGKDASMVRIKGRIRKSDLEELVNKNS